MKRQRQQKVRSFCDDERFYGTYDYIIGRYQGLAKEASSIGDIVKEQIYLNHVEHYTKEKTK